MVGIMPGYIYSEGNVGIISRSGTLTHEIASNLTFRGIGQSTCLGIGGDPVIGTGFVKALQLLRDDDETEAVIMIGEIGGAAEEQAAEYIKTSLLSETRICIYRGSKRSPGQTNGTCGAIVEKGSGTVESKIETLRQAGVNVVNRFDELLEIKIN